MTLVVFCWLVSLLVAFQLGRHVEPSPQEGAND